MTREAYTGAIEIDIGSTQPVKTPGLVALLLLKFISWNDRPTDRPHDAEDAKYKLDIYWDNEVLRFMPNAS